MKKLNVKLTEGEFKNELEEPLRNPDQLYTIFRDIKDEAHETLLVVYIHDDLQSVYDVHSLGAQSASLVDMKKLYGHAYVFRAAYMVLIHNHPSGDCNPSAQDEALIETIRAHEKVAEVKLLDFIIVAGDTYWSHFNEHNGGEYTLGTA